METVASPPENQTPRPLWRERPFMLLITGETISSLGNSIAPIAIAFAVLQLTGSAKDLGLVVAGRSAALAVCILFGGVVADRIPRQVVLIGGALMSGASEAATATLLLTHTARIWEIAALQILNGATSAFVFPAAFGALPQTVPKESLHQANVFSRMGSNATSILGAAVGGTLVAVSGPGWAVAIDAATFGASAIFFSLLRLPHARTRAGAGEGAGAGAGAGADADGGKAETPAQAAEKTGVFHELAAGWADFRSRAWLRSIVLQFCFVNAAIGGVFDVLGPLTARLDLGGARSWGLIMAAYSLGFLVGGLCATRMRYLRHPLLVATFSVLPTGLFMGLLAVPTALAVLCAGSFLAGIGTEIFGVEWNITMQREIPPDLYARLASYDMLGSIVFLPVGQAAIGVIQSAVGLRLAIVICVVFTVVPTLAVLAVRDVRTLSGETRPVPQADLQ